MRRYSHLVEVRRVREDGSSNSSCLASHRHSLHCPSDSGKVGGESELLDGGGDRLDGIVSCVADGGDGDESVVGEEGKDMARGGIEDGLDGDDRSSGGDGARDGVTSETNVGEGGDLTVGGMSSGEVEERRRETEEKKGRKRSATRPFRSRMRRSRKNNSPRSTRI